MTSLLVFVPHFSLVIRLILLDFLDFEEWIGFDQIFQPFNIQIWRSDIFWVIFYVCWVELERTLPIFCKGIFSVYLYFFFCSSGTLIGVHVWESYIGMIKMTLFITVLDHLGPHNDDGNQFHEAVPHCRYTRTWGQLLWSGLYFRSWRRVPKIIWGLGGQHGGACELWWQWWYVNASSPLLFVAFCLMIENPSFVSGLLHSYLPLLHSFRNRFVSPTS